MSTHIDEINAPYVAATTYDELGQHYTALDQLETGAEAQDKILALEVPGNDHLVIVSGDLETFARNVYSAVFGEVPAGAKHTAARTAEASTLQEDPTS